MKLFLLFIFFIIFTGCSLQNKEAGENTVHLKLHGKLTDKTLQEFREALDLIEKNSNDIILNAVQLDSVGGNNSVAIEIGKIIREKKLNTYVADDSRCESACVFILIGGVQRYAFGKIGVHRTTYSRDITDDSIVQNDINESTQLITNYIKSMGVSSLLDDAINNTESWRMRYLSDVEKRHWQVFGIDRFEEELFFNRTARERGISRAEFIKIFKSNYDGCLKEAYYLRSTVLDCSIDKQIKPLSFPERSVIKFSNWLDSL